MRTIIRNDKGFTLVEMLIVVIILGILAAIAVPQFGSSTEDAKLGTMEANLSYLRNSVERYYHEHGATMPGEINHTSGAAVASVDECKAAFVAQLTLFSDKDGKTSNSKTGNFVYGPYVKSVKIPTNPFTDNNAVLCDITVTDITTAASTTTNGEAWKFYAKTGRLISNDGSHDSL